MADDTTTETLIETPVETLDEAAKRERRSFPWRIFREVQPGLWQLTTMRATDKLAEAERVMLETGVEGVLYLPARIGANAFRVPSRKLEAVPL